RVPACAFETWHAVAVAIATIRPAIHRTASPPRGHSGVYPGFRRGPGDDFLFAVFARQRPVRVDDHLRRSALDELGHGKALDVCRVRLVVALAREALVLGADAPASVHRW